MGEFENCESATFRISKPSSVISGKSGLIGCDEAKKGDGRMVVET